MSRPSRQGLVPVLLATVLPLLPGPAFAQPAAPRPATVSMSPRVLKEVAEPDARWTLRNASERASVGVPRSSATDAQRSPLVFKPRPARLSQSTGSRKVAGAAIGVLAGFLLGGSLGVAMAGHSDEDGGLGVVLGGASVGGVLGGIVGAHIF